MCILWKRSHLFVLGQGAVGPQGLNPESKTQFVGEVFRVPETGQCMQNGSVVVEDEELDIVGPAPLVVPTAVCSVV
ncbi:MAG: hypothetical protein QF752_04135 [Planctomycetota bacterium]|jgi:hypothetical protein|nr:hypothetical protein [Planctomycetota bacterium]